MSWIKNLIPKDRKTGRLLRYFENKPHIRSQMVEQLAAGQTAAPADITAHEQVAVAALWCTVRPIDEALQRLSGNALQRSTGPLDSQFYPVLEQTVAGLERDGLDQPAANLLKAGEVLAEMHQQREWAQAFRKLTLEKLEGRLRNLPFLKQRGW